MNAFRVLKVVVATKKCCSRTRFKAFFFSQIVIKKQTDVRFFFFHVDEFFDELSIEYSSSSRETKREKEVPKELPLLRREQERHFREEEQRERFRRRESKRRRGGGTRTEMEKINLTFSVRRPLRTKPSSARKGSLSSSSKPSANRSHSVAHG